MGVKDHSLLDSPLVDNPATVIIQVFVRIYYSTTCIAGTLNNYSAMFSRTQVAKNSSLKFTLLFFTKYFTGCIKNPRIHPYLPFSIITCEMV